MVVNNKKNERVIVLYVLSMKRVLYVINYNSTKGTKGQNVQLPSVKYHVQRVVMFVILEYLQVDYL